MGNAPHTLVSGSGLDVGLPAGQMGNSEVGHMSLGSGRVIYQNITRIDQAISDGSFNTNPAYTNAIDKAVAAGGAVHVFGLLSPGGVHSHEQQIFAAIRLAAEISDGVMGHPIWSVEWALERVEQDVKAGLVKGGKRREDVHVNLAFFVAINPDRREAIEDARTTVAFYASAREYAPFFEAHGFGEEVRRLHELAERKKQAFYGDHVGCNLRVLFEQRESSGLFVGFSDSYVKVAVETDEALAEDGVGG